MGEVVEITKERYEELLQSERELIALESWGVDNWSGYSEAMSSLEED